MKKTIIEMVEQCQGGKDAVAGFLGLTEQALNNRLYQTKGQRFTNEELIAIEQEYGVSHWSDEVNRRLGKVAVNLPSLDELDSVELSSLQLRELAERGILFSQLSAFLEDGELTTVESVIVRRLLHKAQSATLKMVESTIALYQK